MYIENQWYLACLVEELSKKNPLHKKICGRELVIFKTNSGKISVLEDRCCHRNVRLSLGCIHNEHIQCGYHGWEYNQEGKCVNIPSLPSTERIPAGAKITSYPYEIKHRSVWVWIGNPELMDSALIPPMHEMDNYPCVYNYHEVEADLQLVAESLFDAYHINHVHKHSIKTFMGNIYDEKIDFHLKKTDHSLEGSYLRKNDGSFFEKYYFGFSKMVETHFGFWFPNVSKLDIRFKNRHMVIYEHFYQIDEHKVMMCQITLWKNILDFFPPFARWFMLQKSIKIVREDLVFLADNKRIKSSTGKSDLLIKSDEVTFEFMQLWKRKIQQHEELVAQED